MVDGREAFADGRADGAEDQERRQVHVTHQRPAQEAAIFILTMNTAASRRDQHLMTFEDMLRHLDTLSSRFGRHGQSPTPSCVTHRPQMCPYPAVFIVRTC